MSISVSLPLSPFPYQQILGYARKQDGGGWSFSPVAISLLKDFIKQFPVMFQYIISNPKEDTYYEQDLFPYPDGYVRFSYVIMRIHSLQFCCFDTQ